MVALVATTASTGVMADGAVTTRDTVVVFSREGCPYCADAEVFLHGLEQRRPGLVIERHDVVRDPEALATLRALVREHGAEQAAVPAILVRGQLFVGYAGDATTGQAIEALLDAIGGAGVTPRSARVRVPVWGEIDVGELGLPLFTIAIGLVDGFNPCAMWVLLFVLSMLVHLKSRAKMALIGGTFVLVSGLVYFAFMAAWLNFFMLVGVSRVLQVLLGLVAIAIGSIHVKDFFAFGRGLSLSIPESAKPGIYGRVRRVVMAEHVAGAVLGAAVLAMMVNVVELLCTAGLPALYTQILTSQGVSALERYAYLALYNVVYMLDDALMLTVAVVTLSHRKLQESGGRVLKLVSGAVMALLGLVLILRPEWLAWT